MKEMILASLVRTVIIPILIQALDKISTVISDFFTRLNQQLIEVKENGKTDKIE